MTVKFGNFANFIVRNFVVIWEAPSKAKNATQRSATRVARHKWCSVWATKKKHSLGVSLVLVILGTL